MYNKIKKKKGVKIKKIYLFSKKKIIIISSTLIVLTGVVLGVRLGLHNKSSTSYFHPVHLKDTNYSNLGYKSILLRNINLSLDYEDLKDSYDYKEHGNNNSLGISDQDYTFNPSGFIFSNLSKTSNQTPKYLNNHMFNILGNSYNMVLHLIFDELTGDFVHNDIRFQSYFSEDNGDKKFDFDFTSYDINQINEWNVLKSPIWAVNQNGFPINLFCEKCIFVKYYLYLYFMNNSCFLRIYDAPNLDSVDKMRPFFIMEKSNPILDVDSIVYYSSSFISNNDPTGSDFWIKWV